MASKKEDKKYVERNNVYFVGFSKLHTDDQERIKEIIYNDYITLERELKKINSLKLTYKVFDKGGKKKYSVKLMIDAATHPIVVDHMYSQAEWDVITCTHKVLEKARQEIIHKFKTNSNFRKGYEKRI